MQRLQTMYASVFKLRLGGYGTWISLSQWWQWTTEVVIWLDNESHLMYIILLFIYQQYVLFFFQYLKTYPKKSSFSLQWYSTVTVFALYVNMHK